MRKLIKDLITVSKEHGLYHLNHSIIIDEISWTINNKKLFIIYENQYSVVDLNKEELQALVDLLNTVRDEMLNVLVDDFLNFKNFK
jgi:hypothetical protein